MRIQIASRDELRVVVLLDVLYLKASHNYTDFMYVDGRTKSELIGISDIEKLIADTCKKHGCTNTFVRLGRSLLVNTYYVELVSVKLMIISFRGNPQVTLSASKHSLMQLKKYLSENPLSYENLGNFPIGFHRTTFASPSPQPRSTQGVPKG